jgi:hypothetical protein
MCAAIMGAAVICATIMASSAGARPQRYRRKDDAVAWPLLEIFPTLAETAP